MPGHNDPQPVAAVLKYLEALPDYKLGDEWCVLFRPREYRDGTSRDQTIAHVSSVDSSMHLQGLAFIYNSPR